MIKWREGNDLVTGLGSMHSVVAMTPCGKCRVMIATFADIDDPDKDRLVPEFCEACGEDE